MTIVDALIRLYAGFGDGTDEAGIKMLRTQRFADIAWNAWANRHWLRQQMNK